MIALPLKLSTVLVQDYHLERPQTERSTFQKMQTHVQRWEQLTEPCKPSEIDRPAVLKFRNRCLELGLAPSTINAHIRTVTSLARIAGSTTDFKRLKLQERDDPLPTPSLDQLAAAWQLAGSTHWPTTKRVNARPIWCTIAPALWWRAVLMTAFCTGLRRADLFGLTWSQVEPHRIPTRNRKTKKLQFLPIPDPLQPWLELLRRLKTDRVFGVSDRTTQIDRELNRLAGLVAAPELGLQSLRRAAARAYDKAHPGAGKLLLNHGKSVTETHYLETEETLREAATKLVYPPNFLTPPTLDRQLLLF